MLMGGSDHSEEVRGVADRATEDEQRDPDKPCMHSARAYCTPAMYQALRGKWPRPTETMTPSMCVALSELVAVCSVAIVN